MSAHVAPATHTALRTCPRSHGMLEYFLQETKMKTGEMRQKHRGVEAEIRAVRCDGRMMHAYDMPQFLQSSEMAPVLNGACYSTFSSRYCAHGR